MGKLYTVGVVLAYDPFSLEAMTDPYPVYRELRRSAPVYRLEQYDTWALSRFADVWEVLEDRGRFSIVEGPIFSRDRLVTRNAGPPPPADGPLTSFSMIDPPRHTRYRQALRRSFTPRRAETATAALAGFVSDRLDRLASVDRFDVVEDYAGPVSTASTLWFLGLPPGDAAWLRRRATDSVRRAPGQPGITAAGVAARDEVHAYLLDHVQRAPGAVAGDLLDLGVPPEAVAVQLGTVLVGGIETLPKILAGALVRLSGDQGQLRIVRRDPAVLPGAFEEIVRLEGVLQFVGRTLLTDTVVGGQPMIAGQRVMLLLQSANRDEREFADPERFDVCRVIPRHVGFGYGTHFCIGIHAARATGMELLRGFLERFPDYEVDLSGAERPPSEFQIGWTRMPVVVGR
jgi:cytochrome P450